MKVYLRKVILLAHMLVKRVFANDVRSFVNVSAHFCYIIELVDFLLNPCFCI